MAAASESPSEWVKLVSTDGFEFIIPREAATASPMLKDMLDVGIGLSEAHSGTVSLDYRGAVLSIVAEYLMYRRTASNADKKDEVPDFMERIPPELSLEVLMAADFLQT